jgi:hypothetical protein
MAQISLTRSGAFCPTIFVARLISVFGKRSWLVLHVEGGQRWISHREWGVLSGQNRSFAARKITHFYSNSPQIIIRGENNKRIDCFQVQLTSHSAHN